MLACSNEHGATMIRGEAGLFGGALSRILNCGKDFDIRLGSIDEGLLRNIVEAAGSEYAPVEIAGGFTLVSIVWKGWSV